MVGWETWHRHPQAFPTEEGYVIQEDQRQEEDLLKYSPAQGRVGKDKYYMKMEDEVRVSKK